MDPAADFPLKVLLNLSRRQDRRERCAEIFDSLGWTVERQPAVDSRRLKGAHGFASPGRYAHALSTRLILRRAAQAKAEAVLIMEDDIVVSPDLNERLASLALPDDWAILYLGCQHHERPEVIAPGIVRVRAPLDNHAWAVRAPWYMEVRRALSGRYWTEPGPLPAADILVAELARRAPVYAAYPNLIWQREEMSDLMGGVFGNYGPDGVCRAGVEATHGLTAEALGGTAWAPAAQRSRAAVAWFWPSALRPAHAPAAPAPILPPPLTAAGRVAFLFLTKAAHHHAAAWEKWWSAAPERIDRYAHTKDRAATGGGWLEQAQIPEHVPTEWGTLSLVRAQFALLRAALADPQNEFFVFASESCIPVRPLQELIRLLSVDGRSRFGWATVSETTETNPRKQSHLPPSGPIPQSLYRFHPQWLLLCREAAELLIANESLLPLFDGGFAPDEYVPGSLLNLAGYPLESRVARKDVTWTSWTARSKAHPEEFRSPSAATAGDILASGCFLARKFAPGADLRKLA